MKRIVLLGSVLLLSACGAPSPTQDQSAARDAEPTPGSSATASDTSGGATAGFRDSLNTTLDLLEGRLAIFCYGATDNGSMPSADDVMAAVKNSEDLLRHAGNLQQLEPPQGALAVGNDAADLGAAITEMPLTATIIASDLEAGTIEPLAAETVYLERVIEPCDDLFDQIEELREAADVLE